MTKPIPRATLQPSVSSPPTSGVLPRRPSSPVAPLVPILAAVAGGIILDRSIEQFAWAPETFTWGLVGLLAIGLAVPAWRWPRFGLLVFLAACFSLGGGWHHHLCSDLAPDDLAWTISESPHPVWIRGFVREALGVRRSGPAGVGEGQGAATGPPGRVSTRFVIDVTAVRDGDGWRRASGRVLTSVVGDRSDIRAGRAIYAAGSLARVAPPLNPGEFDYRDYLRGEGIWLRMTIKDPASLRPGNPSDDRLRFRWLGAVRRWSRERLVDTLSPEIAPLASALLLGQREEIDGDVSEAFVRTGTTHLLAISGLHLQVLALGLGIALHFVGLSRGSSAAGVACAVVAYATLVGLTPSVVRSAAMTVTICLAVIFLRRSRAANNLALAGLVTLAFNPSDLFDVGCQLSFLAIISLVWMIPETRSFLEAGSRSILERLEGTPSPLDALERKYEPKWKKGLRKCLGWVYYGLLTSTVIWFAALPLVILRFHLVSPIGIALNILLIPLTSAALVTAGLGLGFSALWSPLGLPWGWLTSWLLRWTIDVVHWGSALTSGHFFVASPPWWWACGYYAILGLAVVSAVIVRDRGAETSKRWYLWRRLIWSSMFVWMVGLPFAVVSDRPGRLEVDILAVGHGLAAVIQTPSGAAYLYDCGRMGDPGVGRRVIAPALWSRGISRLNSVILSHADDDHYNGLPDLFDRFRIGEVCIPPGFGGPANPGAEQLIGAIQGRGIPIRTVTAPDSWTVGGARFRLWHPPAGWAVEATDNARSVVLEVEATGRRLLLTGDLEQLGLVELVARPVAGGPIDVMLSPHHGGKTANPAWLYEWARPGAVVVSQRAPIPGSVDLLSGLEQGGTPVYRTWREGAVRLSWNPSGIEIRPYLEDPESVPQLSSASPSIGAMPMSAISWIPSFGPNGWRWAVGISCFLVGLVGVALAALTEFAAWALVVPTREPARPDGEGESDTEAVEGSPISINAPDGSRLSGQWFESPDHLETVGTVLLLHGFGESAGGLGAKRCPGLHREVWDVALPDSRGYGESGGPFASFGAREAGDVGAWIDAIRARESSSAPGKSRPVIVWGRSMGGAIAARAAAEDSRISALVLESPLLDLEAALATILRRRRLPFSSILARGVVRRASRLAGVPVSRPRLVEVAPKVGCPVLILHGSRDSLASIDTVRALALLFARPAEVIEVEGAGHTNVIGVGGDALWDRIMSFLTEIDCLDGRTEKITDNDLDAMAADPDTQRELRLIEAEFAGAEMDGLKADDSPSGALEGLGRQPAAEEMSKPESPS